MKQPEISYTSLWVEADRSNLENYLALSIKAQSMQTLWLQLIPDYKPTKFHTHITKEAYAGMFLAMLFIETKERKLNAYHKKNDILR